MDTKGAGVLVILLFLGLFGAFGMLQTYQHNIAVQENKPVEATILSADEIDVERTDDDTNYYPIIEYEYTVDGQTYTHDNIYPGPFTRSKGSRSGAEAVINQYSSGDQVTVYYNPRDHSSAYLRNDGLPGGWFIGMGYAVIAALAGGWLIFFGFKRWKQRQLINNTPTETAQSLSIGPSEVKGEAKTGDRRPIDAPFSNEQCVIAKYEIKEYDEGDDDDSGSWDTVQEDVYYMPFYVEDETGRVMVRPDDEANYDLDPEDWTETYVDSSSRGPQPIQEFVSASNAVGFPTDSSGKENDRKYRQNLIRKDESVYVFGTTQSREESEISSGADNAERLVIEKVQDEDAMREPMFLISDDKETNLIDRRKWALWRLPVGGFFLVVAFAFTMFTFGPSMGLPIPVLL